MARINLLPWREEYRQEKKKEFVSQMMVVCLIACLAGFAWVSMMDAAISNQNSRNGLLKQEIASLASKVKEIQQLKKDRQEMIARMQMIESLESTRPAIVHYFDEMVKSIPNGVFLNSISRNGEVVSIDGVAESPNRVSDFMRSLDGSEWFSGSALKTMSANTKDGPDAVSFSIVFNLMLPGSGDDEAGLAGGSSNG